MTTVTMLAVLGAVLSVSGMPELHASKSGTLPARTVHVCRSSLSRCLQQ